MERAANQPIQKLQTGIQGFDLIALGGLPVNRTTLVTGTSGSAKTVFAVQFLVSGVRAGEPGVFVTFEEPAEDIRRNVRGFGWDIARFEAENLWAFVDASAQPGDRPVIAGDYDLGGLLARIENAIRKTGARRVSLDSLGSLFSQFQDSATVRNELFRITAALKRMGVTAVLTAERTTEDGDISRFHVEEFVSDNVVILRNTLEQETRRRTVEVLKFRGTTHQKGEFPFTVSPTEGIIVIPLSAMELRQKSSNVRVTSGNEELDRMTGGGFFRDSIILVSGPTGTGKTLITTEFIAGGARSGEKAMLFAFEESREQLFRNASGWGVDFEEMEKSGLLEVVCRYPEAETLEDHVIQIKAAILQAKPNRVAVDSLSALERVASLKMFREFVIALTSFIKHQELIGMFTATTSALLGGSSTTETHISTITDSIILLRYAEVLGEMRRGVTVLKMRGSAHDKEIREFTIDDHGMRIGRPFRNLSGILSGNYAYHAQTELERVNELFKEER